MKTTKKAKRKLEDQRLLIEVEDCRGGYGFAPQWDQRRRERPYWETLTIELVGTVIRPVVLPRVLRPRVKIMVFGDRDLKLELTSDTPTGVGHYKVWPGEIDAAAFVPFDACSAILPLATTQHLSWLTLELSYPSHLSGVVKSFTLDAPFDIESWG